MNKRFTTEAEILAAIDRALDLAEEYLRDAEALERDIKDIQMRDDPSEKWMIDEKLKDIRHARKRATSLVDVRAKWLSEKLAEFRTGTFCFIDDTSIPTTHGVKR